VRQGLFGRPLFRIPLEKHFGWMGMSAALAGVAVYAVAVLLRLNASPVVPAWFAPAVSSVLVLSGFQLMTSWLLVRVLAQLGEREGRVQDDLGVQSETVPHAPVVAAQTRTAMEGLTAPAQSR
jgi:hypothetical protein